MSTSSAAATCVGVLSPGCIDFNLHRSQLLSAAVLDLRRSLPQGWRGTTHTLLLSATVDKRSMRHCRSTDLTCTSCLFIQREMILTAWTFLKIKKKKTWRDANESARTQRQAIYWEIIYVSMFCNRQTLIVFHGVNGPLCPSLFPSADNSSLNQYTV